MFVYLLTDYPNYIHCGVCSYGAGEGIGVSEEIMAGGRARICPESANWSPEWRSQEAALGPEILWFLHSLNGF